MIPEVSIHYTRHLKLHGDALPESGKEDGEKNSELKWQKYARYETCIEWGIQHIYNSISSHQRASVDNAEVRIRCLADPSAPPSLSNDDRTPVPPPRRLGQ